MAQNYLPPAFFGPGILITVFWIETSKSIPGESLILFRIPWVPLLPVEGERNRKAERKGKGKAERK